MNNNIRAFIALDVSAKSTLEQLQHDISAFSKWDPLLVRPLEKENFHFTILFLGEIDQAYIDSIKTKLSELRFEPIEIIYKTIGGFPSTNVARIIWIGIEEEGRRNLVDLANMVLSKMAQIGFTCAKPFVPHLTLFRVKTGYLRTENILSRYEGKTFGSEVIRKICLKRSILTYSGPVYSDIFTVCAK